MTEAFHGENMSGDENVDTARRSVRTYVPAYQKEEWERHAERMDMSLSEFVRSMVQAGRRGYTGDGARSHEPSENGGADLEDRVIAALADAECLSWEELLTEVTDDVEAQLEETLQSSDRIQHSPRNGGYVLGEEP